MTSEQCRVVVITQSFLCFLIVIILNALILFLALSGLRGCKNRPALFPGRMSYKVTTPGLVYLIS